MDTQRNVLAELLRLYDWRREVGAVITKEQALRYGREKKTAWEAARRILVSSETREGLRLEEGFIYWTHEGYVSRFSEETSVTELLGPGGWTPAP